MPEPAAALYLPARAKLNLVLRVVGRRADGYHLLETLFHTLELHDDVHLERLPFAGPITAEVTADLPELMVPGGADNLAVRALSLFRERTGDGAALRLRLHKRIPHGAGLGGGSSDAAAALRLANALAEAPLDDGELARLAVRLGADVPFFLGGGTQWGRGIGDELTPAPHPRQDFLLVVPPFGCATRAVYENHARLWNDGAAQATLRGVTVPDMALAPGGEAAVGFGYGNDLEPAAERVQPELGRLRRAIVARGHATVRMTGSGSTLFVPCADAAAAALCARDLSALPFAGVRLLAVRSGPPAGTDRPMAMPVDSPG